MRCSFVHRREDVCGDSCGDRRMIQIDHFQVNGLLFAGGDSLSDMIKNCTGEHQPLRKMMEVAEVQMPAKDTGPAVRKTKVVSVVGDAKWIWSMMGCIVNWLRPLLSGPFPRAALLQKVWIPAVYDREFYKAIVDLDEV